MLVWDTIKSYVLYHPGWKIIRLEHKTSQESRCLIISADLYNNFFSIIPAVRADMRVGGSLFVSTHNKIHQYTLPEGQFLLAGTGLAAEWKFCIALDQHFSPRFSRYAGPHSHRGLSKPGTFRDTKKLQSPTFFVRIWKRWMQFQCILVRNFCNRI